VIFFTAGVFAASFVFDHYQEKNKELLEDEITNMRRIGCQECKELGRQEAREEFEEKIKRATEIINKGVRLPDLEPVTWYFKKEKDKDLRRVERIYGGRIKELSRRYGVDEDLVKAIIVVESGGSEKALSHAGARGLMGIMPRTAKMLEIDPLHPYENIKGGIIYIKYLRERFKCIDAALAAYNLGPTKMASLQKIEFNPAEYVYVQRVREVWRRASGRT
jgi:soluble lytic murein transglycosylase-like protein